MSTLPRPATATPERAYVWVWLPGATEPVVAGQLRADGDLISFNYGRSYLERREAIPLYLPELPLRTGRIRPSGALQVAGCIRDAGPDAWGQRVILARHAGRLTKSSDPADLTLLTYLLESGSDRIGALDFQTSPTEYVSRSSSATLAEVQSATDRFLAGEPFSPELDAALMRGTSIGGARPKVLLSEMVPGRPDRDIIAKLSVQSDPYPVVKAEAVAMDLAHRVGLNVAGTRLTECLGRDVLLVDRFDRCPVSGSAQIASRQRRLVVSALTMLGLDELEGRYATYHQLADLIRERFTDPDATLHELFSRIVFNICVGNTDDHARNHAAFWDGSALTLTPAYDLCPQLRSGESADQAMAISRDGRRTSQLAVCLDAAEVYHLSRAQATEIAEHQVTVITEQWHDAAEAARLTAAEREQLWGRQILNPAIHYKQ
jgi:serine/threonine-protein kinase HipA